MTVTVLILASLLLGESPPAPKKAYPDLFESHECHFTDAQGQPQVAGYQLFVPRPVVEAASCRFGARSQTRLEAASTAVEVASSRFPPPDAATERYPLLVFPVFGDLLNSTVLTDPEHSEKYRFFVLVVGSADHFDRILEDIVRAHPIDQDRVYLTGPSRGGNVCWEISLRHPELVAAAAPLAAAGNPAGAANQVKVPTWAFANQGDTPFRVSSEEMVAAIQHAGGNAHLTILPRNDHDSWSPAFHQYGVMAWLLEQHRGGPYWTPPGYDTWRWWHIVTLPCLLLVFVRLVWSVEQECRRRKAIRAALAELEAAEADFCLDDSLSENEPVESFEDAENPEQNPLS